MTRQELEARVRSIQAQLVNTQPLMEIKTMATKKAAPAANSAPPTTTEKTPAPAKAEVDPNVVTLAEVCKEVGTTGTVARRKLRAAKLQRDGRWAWPKGSKELAEVKKLITPKEEEEAPAAAN